MNRDTAFQLFIFGQAMMLFGAIVWLHELFGPLGLMAAGLLASVTAFASLYREEGEIL